MEWNNGLDFGVMKWRFPLGYSLTAKLYTCSLFSQIICRRNVIWNKSQKEEWNLGSRFYYSQLAYAYFSVENIFVKKAILTEQVCVSLITIPSRKHYKASLRTIKKSECGSKECWKKELENRRKFKNLCSFLKETFPRSTQF